MRNTWTIPLLSCQGNISSSCFEFSSCPSPLTGKCIRRYTGMCDCLCVWEWRQVKTIACLAVCHLGATVMGEHRWVDLLLARVPEACICTAHHLYLCRFSFIF